MLVVTGDADLAEIRPLVEDVFADWKPGTMPATETPRSDGPQSSAVYLIDKPGTPQPVIRAALVAPPRKQGDSLARQAFHTELGGSFTSRLKMPLREKQGVASVASRDILRAMGSKVVFYGPP